MTKSNKAREGEKNKDQNKDMTTRKIYVTRCKKKKKKKKKFMIMIQVDKQIHYTAMY
jgi:hypothetical protein